MKNKFKFINKIKLRSNMTIRNALKIFNQTSPLTNNKGFGFLVDKDDRCIGIITDGDIRRALLLENNLNLKLINLKKKKFISLDQNYNELDLIAYFEKNSAPIPILNKQKKVIDLIFKNDLLDQKNSQDIIYQIKIPLRISFSGGGYDFTSQIVETPLKIFSANIKKYIYTKLKTRKDKKIIINNLIIEKNYYFESINSIANQVSMKDLVICAINFFKPKLGFELEIYSDVETGTGLGSSSVITFSILKILSMSENIKITDLEIANLAYKIERLFFKIKGGWQDQISVARIGFKLITLKKDNFKILKIKPTEEFLENLEKNILLIKFNNFRKKPKNQNLQPKLVSSDFIKKINNLTDDMVSAFLNEDYKKFTEIININWKIKYLRNKILKSKKLVQLIKKLDSFKIDALKLLGASGSSYLMIFAERSLHKKIISSLEGSYSQYEHIFFEDRPINVITSIVKL